MFHFSPTNTEENAMGMSVWTEEGARVGERETERVQLKVALSSGGQNQETIEKQTS